MNWRRCLALTIVVSGALSAEVAAQSDPLTFDRLSCMSWQELESLYRAATPGELPTGFVRGKTQYHPCAPLARARTKMANWMWKGKHFHPEDMTLINQWPGFRAIRADVYPGSSWLDGQPAHILDYADKSFVWRDARDEMREVGPGLYVGAMYIRDCPTPWLKTLFVLEAVGCHGCP